jgi:hypothetical protein
MSSGRANKLAGQIGEYLVCAELGRRGLVATPFSGNVPTFDVLATDELCRTVPIQVKATRGDNWPSDARTWMDIEFDRDTGVQKCLGPAPISNPELIYVCVTIASPGGRDRFFVLTMADLQKVCVDGYARWMGPHQWKRPRSAESYDCRYGVDAISGFEDNWDLIIRRLRTSAPDRSLLPGGQ